MKPERIMLWAFGLIVLLSTPTFADANPLDNLLAFYAGLSGMMCILAIVVVILLILGFIFWLWMVIDAIANRDYLWIALFIISFFTGFLQGIIAIIYYFLAYGKRRT